MPIVALVGYGVFLLLAFGLRSWLHYRRTGRTGFVGISGTAGSAEWVGGFLFAVALVAVGVAPVLQLGGWVTSAPLLAHPAVYVAGIGMYLVGSAGTLVAQFAMGDAWRIGVDEGARTALIARGPYSWVRNPIFSGMLLAALGLTLLVPNVVSILATTALALALEIQVRLVEEPYLVRTHGEAYRRYLATTGRFVPGIGRSMAGGW